MHPFQFAKMAAGAVLIMIVLLAARRLLHATLRSMLRVKSTPGREISLRDRVVQRYENQRFSAWMFAWFKTRLDPMFDELPVWLQPISQPNALLDLGCGFGFTSSFLLELFPSTEIFAIDPSADRVRGAAGALGARAHVFQGEAPDFEQQAFPSHFDAVLFVDVLHFLPDDALDLTLRRIHNRLNEGNYLIVRAPVVPAGFGSLRWHAYHVFGLFTGSFTCFRTVDQVRQRMTRAGFEMLTVKMSGTNPELFWFISSAGSPAAIAAE